jgi:hypothetical protein
MRSRLFGMIPLFSSLILSLSLATPAAAQTQTIPLDKLGDYTLSWDYSTTFVSWWAVCSPTCVTIPAPGPTSVVTPTGKTYSTGLPVRAAGSFTLTVKACNDAGCAVSAGVPLIYALSVPPAFPSTPVVAPKVVPIVFGNGMEDVRGLTLRADSVYKGRGTDGKDMGADVAALLKATCGVRAGRPCDENGNLLTDAQLRAGQ